jgi:hypothetical protein
VDDESKHAISILRALSDAVTRLDLFGYDLFIQRRAPSRVPCRSVSTGGRPFKLGREEFERGFFFGCSIYIDATKERAVSFGVTFAWNCEEWFIQAMTEEQDDRRENCTRDLWESPGYRVRSASDAITTLQKVLDSLEASVTEPSVAVVLDAIPKP